MKTAKKVVCIVLVVCLLAGMLMIPARANGYIAVIKKVFDWGTAILGFVDQALNTTVTVAEIIDRADGTSAPAALWRQSAGNFMYVCVTEQSISDIVVELNSAGLPCTKAQVTFTALGDITIPRSQRQPVWVVQFTHPDYIAPVDQSYFLCNSFGYIYMAPVDDQSAANTPQKYYTESSGSYTDQRDYSHHDHFHTEENTTVYDYSTDIEKQIIDERTFTDLSTNTEYEIEEFYYDSSRQTYDMRVSDSYNTYDYSVTYNVAYTSVTYIGASEEFNETYIYYFELPDGRSSADLTVEDLEQLSLNFDVVNYGVSCDDGSLRSLYHFDGDVEDTSYWTNYTSFEWLENASITYLESNAFNGCLYMDELAHSFKISLPNNLAAGDFSILFRYYQSQYGTEGTDMTIDCGDVNLLSYAGTDLPVGSWVEIALIRDSGTLYVYENGLCVSSGALASVLDRELTFAWVEGTQNYHWLDELRVYNFAYYADGAPYMPTAVPVDTNAVLVLPDEASPIPDAYWDFNDEGNMLPISDLTVDLPELLGYPHVRTSFSNAQVYFNSSADYAYAIYQPVSGTSGDYTYHGSVDVNCVTLEPLDSYSTPSISRSGEYEYLTASDGYVVPFYHDMFSGNGGTLLDLGLEAGKTYTFSVVLSDGSVSSITFTPVEFTSNSSTDSVSADFDWGSLVYTDYCGSASGPSWRGVGIQPIRPIDVVYIELVEGDTPNDGHEMVTEVYSSLELTGPTIAVRSQIDVRTYRIGGVRPTLAYRGDVWCLVENNRIASCQIYNGFAWTEVDCRIWTGVRWVPPSYYDVVTLQDLFDVEGTTDNEYIQTETGYYKWLQTQFKELLEILNTISDKIEDIGGGSSISMDFDIDGVLVNFSDLSDGSTFRLLEVFIFFDEVLFDGLLHDETFSFDDYKDVFMGDTVTDGEETGFSVFSIFNYTGDDIWE